MKHFLIRLAQKASKGRINIAHIEEEIDRHASIMKLLLLIFLPILLLSLILWVVKGLFYIDVLFISIASFIAASFLPDILTLMAFCFHKNHYRLFHSSKGMLISLVSGFALFMAFLPFHKSLFITSMIFAGYAAHLSIDKIEKLQEFICSAVKRFQKKQSCAIHI